MMMRSRMLLAMTATAATLAATQPAFAFDFFQRLFGGFRVHHRAPPPETDGYGGGASAYANAPSESGEDRRGPATALCVRTCDGFHFVVRANPRASAADMCRAFCPASATRLYSGSNIDYATASDGSRYAESSTAFLYRKQSVAGCSCNGRGAFGLAPIDIDHDPTLRAGDLVQTRTGLMSVAPSKDRAANFTLVPATNRSASR